MAQNDMEVIMYKILKYLYECMKADVLPRMEDINCTCQMFRIPLRYWGMIMDELFSRGLIKGFRRITTKGTVIIQMIDNPGITYEGRQFLVENSGMKRAAEFTGNAFAVLLDGIVAALI